MTKTQKTVYYILLALTSAAFLMAAYPKLIGDPVSVAGFTKAHLPIWFMYFVGVAEVCGAIGLWVPKLQKWAAYGLYFVLVSAAVVTIFFDNPVMVIIPAVVFAILSYARKLSKKGSVMPSSMVPASPAPTM